MSTAPGTTDPNAKLYVMGGLIGAVFVLCGGFGVMAYYTMDIVHRGVDTQRYVGSTTTTTSDSTEPSTKEESGADPSFDVAHQFLAALQSRNVDSAYNMMLDNDESMASFRQRMDGYPHVYGFQGRRLSRDYSGPANEAKFTVTLTHPRAGEGTYLLLLAKAEDGSWKVDRFKPAR
jgi:hypothetical protein